MFVRNELFVVTKSLLHLIAHPWAHAIWDAYEYAQTYFDTTGLTKRQKHIVFVATAFSATVDADT